MEQGSIVRCPLPHKWLAARAKGRKRGQIAAVFRAGRGQVVAQLALVEISGDRFDEIFASRLANRGRRSIINSW
jgi:hypothetical protein